ncbi:MAG: aldehyde dehydrogenase (NADP(+)) [Chitinophagaceae bacterium]|nr:MAG: aldehyde dehydrogenase (NADP(+)) [Chitinophagaceae bacterium]
MEAQSQHPEVDAALKAAAEAGSVYASGSLRARAGFLTAIAESLDGAAADLVATAARETHLDEGRLRLELQRTQWQLHSYGAACLDGGTLDLRIDSPRAASVDEADGGTLHRSQEEARSQDSAPAVPAWQSVAAKQDLRKMLVPLGPVVVFGASNFPFAYSTAGGDTACALAAGCPVIVKAHPAHAETSRLVAAAVSRAAVACGLPEALFQHLEGGFELGAALVQHPLTAAVGFTGSLEGGRALFDLAAARPRPIPVFAEMGSVNPVFLLPRQLAGEADETARLLAASIINSAGQFCTKPGLLIGIEGPALDHFAEALAKRVSIVPPAEMLHPGIAKSFQHKRADALGVEGVAVAGTLSCPVGRNESIPTLATVSGDVFLQQPGLHGEVFGPFALLVRCRDAAQLQQVAESLEGQLTCTLMATTEELRELPELVTTLQARCGRLVRNGVPTGVDVVAAMHHGGPYPATTDPRFTAVGADGIRRFARPVCYQNWEEELLPDELKSANPLGLWRQVNGRLTQAGF